MGDNDEEDVASSCGSPVKDKENFSPKSTKSRQSIETQHEVFNTVLKDFDQNGKWIVSPCHNSNSFLFMQLSCSD